MWENTLIIFSAAVTGTNAVSKSNSCIIQTSLCLSRWQVCMDGRIQGTSKTSEMKPFGRNTKMLENNKMSYYICHLKSNSSKKPTFVSHVREGVFNCSRPWRCFNRQNWVKQPFSIGRRIWTLLISNKNNSWCCRELLNRIERLISCTFAPKLR